MPPGPSAYIDPENRLLAFNRERAAIIADVERRVVAEKVALAARGGDHSLEYILNDAAFQEIRRLENGPALPEEHRRLREWRGLARRLATMTEADKRQKLVDLVHEHASDVAGHFNPLVYRFARGVLPPLLTALLSPRSLAGGLDLLNQLAGRVIVDGPIEHLRRCAGRGTLVFTPTHSSNMDSVVIGWALEHAHLPPVTYGAGKNLFSNRFISFFMQNLGAYRVDRRLRHRLYKDVLKAYSTVLLERGYHSLFFPGGTRSRSGMVERRLKLGLLGTTISAFANVVRAGRPDRRIYVVPATLNYAMTLEAETLVDDHLAEQGKHRYIIEDDEFSRLERLYDFARKMLAMEGSLVIRFGTPLDPVGNPVDDGGESLDPRGRRVDPARYLLGPDGRVADDPQRDAEYTSGLGDAVLESYRRLTVLMPTHLVARVLFDHVAGEQGTRDIYRLLRVGVSTTAPIAAVREGVERWRVWLREQPDAGGIPERVAGLSPREVVDEALAAFQGYHRRPVAERDGGRVVVRQMRLLHYYANRTAHLPGPAVAARAAGAVA